MNQPFFILDVAASDSAVGSASVNFAAIADTGYDCAGIVNDELNIDAVGNYMGEIVSLAATAVGATAVQIATNAFCAS